MRRVGLAPVGEQIVLRQGAIFATLIELAQSRSRRAARGNSHCARALRDAEALGKIRGAPDRDALFRIIANAA
jgi:hypothetical protein